MKKLVLLVYLTFVSNLIFSQENNIPKDQLLKLKELYKWNEEKVLIVNFYFPKKNCRYNHYEDLKKGRNWFINNIYKSINLSNVKNIFVYSDKIAAKKIIDNEQCFEDYENFFLKNFFIEDGYCHGIMVISNEGKISYMFGEFLSEHVELLLKNVN
jgi:hypothetical protein